MTAITGDVKISEKRKSIREVAFELWNQMKRIEKTNGGLCTRAQAKVLLNCTRQHIERLIKEGKLREISFYGKKYIAGNDVFNYIDKHLGKGGRPTKNKILNAFKNMYNYE